MLKNLDVVYLNVNYTGTHNKTLSQECCSEQSITTLSNLTLDFAVSNLHFSFIILYVVYMLLGFRCVTICRFSGEPFMCSTVKLGHWAVHSFTVILHTATSYLRVLCITLFFSITKSTFLSHNIPI